MYEANFADKRPVIETRRERTLRRRVGEIFRRAQPADNRVPLGCLANGDALALLLIFRLPDVRSRRLCLTAIPLMSSVTAMGGGRAGEEWGARYYCRVIILAPTCAARSVATKPAATVIGDRDACTRTTTVPITPARGVQIFPRNPVKRTATTRRNLCDQILVRNTKTKKKKNALFVLVSGDGFFY